MFVTNDCIVPELLHEHDIDVGLQQRGTDLFQHRVQNLGKHMEFKNPNNWDLDHTQPLHGLI